MWRRILAPGAAVAGSGATVQVTCWSWAKRAEESRRSKTGTDAFFAKAPKKASVPFWPRFLVTGFAQLQFIFNLLVDVAPGEFGGDTDRVLDGVDVAAAVADDASAAHAEQRSAAILGVIQALLERRESTLGKRIADLTGDGGLQRIAEEFLEHVHQALADLECDVADEAVANDDVDLARVHVAAFDVADEIEPQALEQRPGRARHVVALVIFLADRENADAWIGTPQHLS